MGSPVLTALAVDWRKLLFPEATDERSADGYAQAVTFGLLMARAKGIPLASGFENVAHELTHTSSLIGAALRLLTDNAENQATLKTSLGTLTRVLDAVHWPTISKGQPDHWLAEYTTELINVLNVLGCLVDLEPAQAALLEKICSDPTITAEELRAAGAFEQPAERKRRPSQAAHADLFYTPGL